VAGSPFWKALLFLLSPEGAAGEDEEKTGVDRRSGLDEVSAAAAEVVVVVEVDAVNDDDDDEEEVQSGEDLFICSASSSS